MDDLKSKTLFITGASRGIGKAMLAYVLRRMQAEHGLQRAYVCYEVDETNPGAGAFYQSVGFRPKYAIHDYIKSLPAR